MVMVWVSLVLGLAFGLEQWLEVGLGLGICFGLG
jgi:hypothetical protein